MPDPAEDIPADRPLRWSDRHLEFGTFGFGVTGASRVGTMVEPADQLHRAIEGVKATIAMVADIHHATAGRTIAVEDVEFPESEIGIRGPFVRHPADLHVRVDPSIARTTGYMRKTGRSSSMSGR